MFSARLQQFFSLANRYNFECVFVLAFANVFFFPFSFPFRVWMNSSMTTKQVSGVCLSVWLSVHWAVSVLSLNSLFCCLFDVQLRCWNVARLKAPHAQLHMNHIMHGASSCVDATAVGANLHGLALKTVCDGSWQICEPHSDMPDRAMAIRHSHFGLQRRVTPNTIVA